MPVIQEFVHSKCIANACALSILLSGKVCLIIFGKSKTGRLSNLFPV